MRMQDQDQFRQFRIARNRRILDGVVRGIAHYGNCFGIPTIAGEVYFDKSYEGNPLVNAFCLGVLLYVLKLVTPEALECFRPFVKWPDRVSVGSIHHVPSIAPRSHQPHILQHAQML